MYEDIVVGRVYNSRKWGDFEIVSRKHGEGTQIRFVRTGNIESTNAKEIRDGKVCDRKALEAGLYKSGDVVPTNHWGDVEIVSAERQLKLVVRFLNTGNIREGVRGPELKTGKCKDVRASEAGVKPLNFVSPQKEAAFMQSGGIYPSNFWGDMEILEYKSSTEVLIRFCESGNTFLASRDNVLKGLVKDTERSMAITKAKHEAGRALKVETKARADAIARELKRIDDEALVTKKAETQLAADGRNRWYKIMRDFKCHFDAEGKLLAGAECVDRNGFKYTIIRKKSFDSSSWFVWYHNSGNIYCPPEQAVKSGDFYDKLSEDAVQAEKYRIKTVNAKKYEADRERRIAMACAYQKNNVEKTRVRNRNRNARRKGAVGTHTVEETNALRASQGNKCACCGIELDETRQLDHMMPLKLGGSNYIDNLQWLCAFCNGSKNATHPDEWAVYSASEAFKRRRMERLSSEHEDWKSIVQSMPLLCEFSLCCG